MGPRDMASGPAQTAAERIGGGGGKEGSDVATVGCGFRIWEWPGRDARWAHNRLISLLNKAVVVQWT